jgi:hypothetical protein
MLYSQLNYVGCVLPVPENTVEAIENAIHLYASGYLRLAKKRVFLPIKLGGLGLFDVKNFLDAQKCSWLRHCKIIDQNWKLVLANSGWGNLFNVTEKEIDRELNLIPYEIARAYRSLIVKFTGKDHNYREAFILNNEALPVSVRRKIPLRVEDLDPEIIENNERMLIFCNLKIKNLMDGETFINKPTFCALYRLMFQGNCGKSSIRSGASQKPNTDPVPPRRPKVLKIFLRLGRVGVKKQETY